jgi:hypothetical protein
MDGIIPDHPDETHQCGSGVPQNKWKLSLLFAAPRVRGNQLALLEAEGRAPP